MVCRTVKEEGREEPEAGQGEGKTCPRGDVARDRQGSVREGSGWVPQWTDNDGEKNITLFFLGL